MTVSEQIDKLLLDSENGEFIVLHSDQSDLYFKAVDVASAYSLIIKRGHVYDLTQLGYEVIESGGFEQWKINRKNREDESHQATLDSAKATVDAAQSSRQSKNAAIIGIAVTLILFAISYVRDNQSGDKINALERRLDTLSALTKVQSQSPPVKADSTQSRRKK